MAILHVQDAHASSAGAASVVVHLASNVTSGNFLAATVALPASVSVASITDSASRRWIQAAYASSEGGNSEIWTCRGAASGTASVTCNFTSAGSIGVNVSEWSGVYWVDPLDQWSQNFGDSASIVSQNVSPRASGDLVLSAISTDASSVGAITGGYTSLGISGATGYLAAYDILSGSVSPTLKCVISGSTDVSVTDYTLPGLGVTTLCLGSDNNLWVGDNGAVWRVNESGAARRFPLAGEFLDICSGPDGNLWATDIGAGAFAGRVWKITTSGVGTSYNLVGSNPNGICAGPDGNLWVADGAGAVWKVTTSGTPTQYTLTGSYQPYDICTGSDGKLWVTDVAASVWSVTTSGVGTAHSLVGSEPAQICAGPDGNLWMTDDEGGGTVWKITTAGSGTPYSLSGLSLPSGICVGSDSNLWIADSALDAVWRVTTSGAVTEYSFTGGELFGGVCSGPDGNLWLTNTATNGVSTADITGDWAIAQAAFVAGSSGTNPNLQFPEVLVETCTLPNYLAPVQGVGVWTNISKYVRSMNIGPLGRQHELDRIQSTSGHFIVNNRDGSFNNWNTASFLYNSGNGLNPMNPVKATAAWNGVTYPIYYGYLQALDPQIADVVNLDVEIVCQDILQDLSLKYMAGDVYSQQVIADGGPSLEAYYRCGDAIGTYTILDSSGNDYTGSLVDGVSGTPLFGATGAFLADANTAIDLTNKTNAPNGGFQMVDNTTQPPTSYNPLSGASAWTMELWAKYTGGSSKIPATNEQNMALFSALPNGAVSPLFVSVGVGVNGNLDPLPNRVMFVTSGNALDSPAFSSSSTVVFDGAWHYIAFTQDVSGTQTVYIDGKADHGAYSLLPIGGNDELSEVTFGCGIGATSGFAGTIQDCALYSTALTASQIAEHYQIGMWFQSEEYGASVGGTSAGRFNKVMGVAGLDPSVMLNVPYPFKTLNYAETGVVTTTSALNYMQTVAFSEPGLIFQSPDGMLAAYNRQYQYRNPTSVTSQATFADAASVSYHYDGTSLAISQDDIDTWNDIQSQSGRSGSILQVWGPVQSSVAAQSASVYGARTLQGLTSLLQEYDSDALALAQNYLAWYSNPIPRVNQMVVNSYTNGGVNLPKMLGLGIYDRITVVYYGQTPNSPFQQDSLIEQISHDVTMEGPSWNTKWGLSPYEILLNPIICDSSTLDGPDVLTL